MPENVEIKLIDGNHDNGTTPEAKVLKAQRHIIKSFRSKYNANRRWYDVFADYMTEQFGSIWFFVFNFVWYLAWFLWNGDFFPGLPKFDPYPHNFLTMIVSLEAIFLSIVVLISQNSQSKIGEMREEIDFNINVRSEQEITKILNMLDKIHDRLGINNVEDEELAEMKRDTDLEEIELLIAQDYDKKKKSK